MAVTRASDADRDACLEEIEAAFADGRIDDPEREARTQAALQAVTTSELTRLVSDLGASHAGLRPGRSTMVRLRLVLLGALGLAVAGVVALVAVVGGDDAPATPAPLSSAATPPSDRLQLHTAAGLKQLVTLTRAKFGTASVASAAIYPDYASLEIVLTDDPRHVERWYFAKGFEGRPSRSSRPAEAVTTDLAAIDPTAYAKALR